MYCQQGCIKNEQYVQEAQAAGIRLKQEKDMLQRSLLAAGIPFPPLPNDFNPPQPWLGMGHHLGLGPLAPTSLPHVATPSSAYSAFSIPFPLQHPPLQPPPNSGFQPCQTDTPLSQTHFLPPTSASLHSQARATASQALPASNLNGNGADTTASSWKNSNVVQGNARPFWVIMMSARAFVGKA